MKTTQSTIKSGDYEGQMLKRLKCTRCGHVWIPRTDNPPKFCPKCNSPYWNKERKIKGGKITMLYTIKNSFHNTEAQTKYSPEERYDIDMRIAQGDATDAEKQARRRAHNKLCGSPTCTCGNSWGERE